MKTKNLYTFFLSVTVLLFACRKQSLTAISNNTSAQEESALVSLKSRVYVFESTSILARDLETGQEYWTYNLPQLMNPTGGAIIAGNAAYFITYSGLVSTLNKLNLDTKIIVWQKIIDTQTSDSISGLKRVLYDSGKIFIQVDHLELKGKRTTTTKLSALDTSTGNSLWQSYITTKAAPYKILSESTNPAIFKGTIVLGLGHDMAAVNAASGSLLWRKKIDESSAFLMSPCINNGVIFSGTTTVLDGFLFALKISTGKIVWQSGIVDHFRYSYISSYNAPCPTIINGKVIVNGDNIILAHNATNGSKLWQYADSGSISDPLYFLAVTNLDSTIYTTNIAGTKTYAIDAGNGMLKYANGYYSYASSNAAPVAANGYLMGGKSGLYYKSTVAATGALVWDSGNIGSADILEFVIKDSNGKVYYNTQSGMIQ